MELRKAIEKSKKERQLGVSKKSNVNKVRARLGKESQAEWTPPVYSESRTVNLDPQIIGKNKCVCMFSGPPEIEFYRILRFKILQSAKEKGWNTFMVTSALPGEGKTLTSINLALTFAKEFSQTVLLVDCDLKRQSIHKYLGFSSDIGLSNYLVNGNPLKDLIVWPGVEKLTLISGGNLIQDSTEFMGSSKMKELVADLKSRYADRYVFFDVPPILAGADAITFSPLVDGILVVVEAGKTSINEVKRALKLIPAEKILGLVLNRQKSPRDAYIYPYNVGKI